MHPGHGEGGAVSGGGAKLEPAVICVPAVSPRPEPDPELAREQRWTARARPGRRGRAAESTTSKRSGARPARGRNAERGAAWTGGFICRPPGRYFIPRPGGRDHLDRWIFTGRSGFGGLQARETRLLGRAEGRFCKPRVLHGPSRDYHGPTMARRRRSPDQRGSSDCPPPPAVS